MKKTLCILSSVLLLLAMMTACGKKENPVVDHPNTNVPVSHSTTKPEFTVGDGNSSRMTETGENTYEIEYFDEKGFSVKKEYYENETLIYYIVIAGTDKNRNATREEYYTADGMLFGVYDDRFFYDGDGNQISEDVMEANLYKATHPEEK